MIIIGSRRFVLVDDVSAAPADGQQYEPTPEEVEMLEEAAADTRPHLSGKDVDAYLSRRRRELGLDR